MMCFNFFNFQFNDNKDHFHLIKVNLSSYLDTQPSIRMNKTDCFTSVTMSSYFYPN